MTLIMVIEDASIVREPLDAALSRAGYETVTAEHGAAALSLMAEPESRIPDVILLDMAMPVMDGLTFLKRLRADSRAKHIPVIVLTAVADRTQIVQAAQYGICGYLLKSRFSLSELLQQVSKALNAKAAPAQATKQPQVVAAASQPMLAPQRPAESATGAPVPHAPVKPKADFVPPPSHGVSDSEEDSTELLKSLKPLMSRSEIMERIDGCDELKGLSPAVTQVLKLTGSSRCSIEQVAKVISTDHAIALKVLKLANSAVYTRGEPVDSVHLAVSRIGLGQIRQTVLNLAVIDQFSSTGGCSAIHPGQFWEHGIATGIIAAEIMHQREQKDVDTAFTMGLLHDVGRLFFADRFGETYARVIETARSAQLPLEQVESRMLLYNHADVMDRMLHAWKFPKQLINPIVFHHLSAGNIRRSAPRQIEEVATLGIANRLAHAMMLGSSGNEAVYPTEELCEMLRLDPEIIVSIQGKAREETDKMKFALLASSNAGNWPQLQHEHAKSIGAPFRPLFTSMTPKYDAYRIFCEELAGAVIESSEDSKPNIGVLHIAHARDRVAVTTQYKQAENAAGVSALPLLVLSPGGKILPENSLLASRAIEALPTPVVIERFTAAAQKLLGGAALRAAA
ncbi:MAG TPA: response regulator [Phycisphaerales bacterium]|nr:response regulator [Phycisphaerales bacterium]